MHAVVRHYITDGGKWDASVQNIMSVIERQQLPSGIKPVAFLPGADGRNADCVWETGSLRDLQQFLDPKMAGAARNEYFELNYKAAIGLPKGEEATATAL